MVMPGRDLCNGVPIEWHSQYTACNNWNETSVATCPTTKCLSAVGDSNKKAPCSQGYTHFGLPVAAEKRRGGGARSNYCTRSKGPPGFDQSHRQTSAIPAGLR